MEHFTTSDQPRALPGAWWAQQWDFLADGEVIGEIVETERGYRGRLTSPERVTIPEQVYRSVVEDLLTRQALIHWAKAKGIVLKLNNIDKVETGYPEIDGMPAYRWVEALTQD